MAYLDDHRPRVRQFRERGTTASGVIVVHTAENVPDTVPVDSGAEGVAAFIANRSDYGSYHRLCDSDTVVDLIRFSQQAYGDGTGSNSHAIHISAATQASRWPSMPKWWIEATVLNMARAAAEANRYVHSLYTSSEVWIPARRITKAQSDQRMEGFISHGERDPGRRYDPGPAFPWGMFLEMYDELAFPKPEKPAKSRGEFVDLTLRKTSAAINAIEQATGHPARQEQIDEAEKYLRRARRTLRDIAIIEMQEKS